MQTLLPALYNTGEQANLDDYLERLELLLPDAAHLITRNPQEFALAYAERYQSDVLSLEQAWTFLTAAQMRAWQREEDEIVVRLTSALAYPAGRRVHLAEVEQVLQRGIEASRRSADTQHLAAFLNRLGGLMVAQGQYDHGQQLWYNGLQLAESARVLPILWEPLASFVHSADILGNYSAARQLLELVRNTNRSKHAESLTAALFIRGFFARVNKNLDEAAEDFSACLRLLLTSSSDKTPLSPTQQLFSMVAQAELARTQGNYAHSQDCTEKALTLAQIYGDHYTLGTLLIDQIIFTCRQDHLDDMCRAVLRLRELSRFVGTPHFQERSRFFDEYLCVRYASVHCPYIARRSAYTDESARTAERARKRSAPAGRRGPCQPRDRRPAGHNPCHGEKTPGTYLCQAQYPQSHLRHCQSPRLADNFLSTENPGPPNVLY